MNIVRHAHVSKKSTDVTKNRRRAQPAVRTISRILHEFLEVERSDGSRREIIFIFYLPVSTLLNGGDIA